MNTENDIGNNGEDDKGFHVVIPARYASTRFPGKPLHSILGKPMILHVIERAKESDALSVVVATDDERIASVCTDAGAEVVMTKAAHPSGTDRIAEVALKKDWPMDARIVGLQGDEPAMPSEHINQLATNLLQHPNAAMATLCFPVQSMEDWQNPDRVKVVRNQQGMALYFSRAPIPFLRDSTDKITSASLTQVFIHIGIYAYRAAFLKEYANLPTSKLETMEQLEQLRVLDAGFQIHADHVSEAVAHGVDRLEDVASMEQILKAQAQR